MPRLSLHWPKDRDGYRIEPAPQPGTGRAAKTILGSVSSGPRIVRNDGRLDFDCDRMKIDGLYRRLADHPPTPEGALAFVSRYGFLRADDAEYVDFICGQIEVVRSLLDRKQARDWESLYLWLIDNRHAISLNPELVGGDPPQLFFRPASLLDAIYIQFFEDLSTGAKLRLCQRPGCGNWFKYGPGTLHRSKAQYCSPKCQKAHYYALTKGDQR